MKIKDRIKELRRVPASELLPSPKNWRTHSEQQQEALKGVLADIGWADAVLARETPDGLMIIDGHLRSEVAADQVLPVLILDVTEAEADLLLATLDPLANMAGTDAAKLEELMADISTGSVALQEMLSQLAEQNGIVPADAPEDFQEVGSDVPTDYCCPKCGYKWSGQGGE